MTTLIIVLLGLLSVALGIVVYYLVKIVKIQINKINTYQEWIVDTRYNVDSTYRKMVKLDDKQMFQKDDDVGILFRELSDLIVDLNNKVVDVE